MKKPTEWPMTEIEAKLLEFDDLPIECDGYARLASAALNEAEIEHCVCKGSVATDGGQAIGLHYWIELLDREQLTWVFDPRLRMFLSARDERIPHGLFRIDAVSINGYHAGPIRYIKESEVAFDPMPVILDVLSEGRYPVTADGLRRSLVQQVLGIA